jgi:hypothetical protein
MHPHWAVHASTPDGMVTLSAAHVGSHLIADHPVPHPPSQSAERDHACRQSSRRHHDRVVEFSCRDLPIGLGHVPGSWRCAGTLAIQLVSRRGMQRPISSVIESYGRRSAISTRWPDTSCVNYRRSAASLSDETASPSTAAKASRGMRMVRPMRIDGITPSATACTPHSGSTASLAPLLRRICAGHGGPVDDHPLRRGRDRQRGGDACARRVRAGNVQRAPAPRPVPASTSSRSPPGSEAP